MLIIPPRKLTLFNKLRKKYSIFSKNGIFNGKAILVANILLNLAILGFFKYYNFFVESFVDAFAMAGVHLQPHTLKIILPVGISFYTFQALSYSIDVYKKKIEPTRDIVAFFAFVSFFPQLVAGPIERATNLLPQFYKRRTFDYAQATDGLRQILWGLFKKIVIADNCALYVNKIFEDYNDYSGATLLLAAVLFAFQIYGDFSGYSDIAIGTARLFGFNLMRNFNFPYFSRDIAEFWRRWHISLTTWFRDYVYIPLGGSRVSKAKVVRNTFVIFLVSGFWHGANWTFIAWGAFHAILFLPLILLNKNRKYTDTVAENRFLPSIKELFQMILTFGLVVLGWVFFRAETIGRAFEYLSGIFDKSLIGKQFDYNKFWLCTMLLCLPILIIVEWLQRNKQHSLQLNIQSTVVRWLIYISLIIVIWAMGGKQETFIYFQF
jgi:D-alanyl-lipoteichoic acid acyltransferase DltB (MBOAT superfamily)